MEGNTHEAISFEASWVAILKEQERLAQEKRNLEMQELELQEPRAQNTRGSPQQSASTTRTVRVAGNAPASQGSKGIRVHRTPTKNLLATVALFNKLASPTSQPTEEDHIRFATLLKAEVEEQ